MKKGKEGDSPQKGTGQKVLVTFEFVELSLCVGWVLKSRELFAGWTSPPPPHTLLTS